MCLRTPLLLALVAACSSAGDGEPGPGGSSGPASTSVVHLGAAVDAEGEGKVVVDVPAGANREVVVDLDGEHRVVEAACEGASMHVGTDAPSTWIRPRPVREPRITIAIAGTAPAKVTVWARGAPPPPVRRERSLTWLDRSIVEHPSVGLARVFEAASDDGHGGKMLERMLRRFASTAHSERPALAALADDIASREGGDASKWNLDDLPFVMTGVHNRLDLSHGDLCGELRISFASTHPTFAPFHMIVLFAQPAAEDDRAPDGSVHCLGTTRRWSRLSLLEGATFESAARRMLDTYLVKENFLFVETLELTVSPWEWRQWVKVGPDALDNPVLFQTVDVEQVNAPGPLRDDFLQWVADNAEALDATRMLVPDRFRAPSARVPPGAPRPALDLTGLRSDVAAKYPDLARKIEIVGCPACHTENAPFVQTSPSRSLSPFYEAELVARAKRMDAMNETGEPPPRRYGPLQD